MSAWVASHNATALFWQCPLCPGNALNPGSRTSAWHQKRMFRVGLLFDPKRTLANFAAPTAASQKTGFNGNNASGLRHDHSCGPAKFILLSARKTLLERIPIHWPPLEV